MLGIIPPSTHRRPLLRRLRVSRIIVHHLRPTHRWMRQSYDLLRLRLAQKISIHVRARRRRNLFDPLPRPLSATARAAPPSPNVTERLPLRRVRHALARSQPRVVVVQRFVSVISRQTRSLPSRERRGERRREQRGERDDDRAPRRAPLSSTNPHRRRPSTSSVVRRRARALAPNGAF